MEAYFRDVRYAARMLRRNAGFTAGLVLCLALGIGANTAVFSAAYAIVLRQLPFPNADALVELRRSRLQPSPLDTKFLSIPATDDIMSQSQRLALVGRYLPASVTLIGGTAPEQLSGLYVTPEWFEALGVQPRLGRPMEPSDAALGKDAVVVLSYGVWQRDFGGRTDLIGSSVLIAAQPANAFYPFAPAGKRFVVIAVMPPKEMFPVDGDLWMPLRPQRFTVQMGASPRSVQNIATIARLRPGVSLTSVNGELHTIAARLAAQYPDTDKGWDLQAVPLREALTEHYRTVSRLLVIAVNLVLLLGCVCISGLLTARNRSRAREMAIREAVGATRAALIRQIMAESLLVGCLGGAAGFAVAAWLIGVIRGLAPATIPRIEDMGVDSTLLVYTLLVSAAAGLAVGILPAVRITEHPLAAVMNTQRSDSRRLGPGYRLRLRGVLIGFEIALAFPIAVGAALTVQSVRNMIRVQLGYDTTDVVTANVKLSSTTCAQFDRCIATMESVLNNVRALPGVREASFVSARPFDIPLATQVTRAVNGNPGQPDSAVIPDFQLVTPDYFKTLGIPLLSGRYLVASDGKETPLVAVVNQSLAKALFARSDPVGRTFSVPRTDVPVEIVGEVSDIRDISLTKVPRPAFYVPYVQFNLIPRTVLLVKTTEALATLAPAMVAQVHAVDPEAPVTAIEGLDQVIAQQRAESGFEAIILAGFAALGVLLTVFGIHGLVSYATSERLREFGIRLAVGARPRDIFRLIVQEGVATILCGLTFGIAAAVAFSQYLRSQLYGISPTDPSVFIGTALMIALAALLGYGLPALRATSVDPLTVLRHD